MKFCDRPYRFIYTEGYAKPGTITMCPWMCYSPAREIGNILEEDLYTIWHGEKAEVLRRTIEDQSFKYCQKMSCPYLENDSLPDISEEEFKKRAVPLEYPDQFNIAHDLTCNHKCPSCRYEIFKGNEEYADKMAKINDNILPYLNKASKITGCGLGDAFSSPYIMDLLERIEPERPGMGITLETNGVLCDEAHWERLGHLCNSCKVSVSVTPNSFNRGVYKYLAGGLDDLDKLVHNLYLLRDMRNQGKIASFNTTIVVQESNFRELPEFVDRSLNDFKADSVVIRTIYKWNKMTVEDYWFKDVMNPLHPYHKDMLEIMKDPILKDPRVYNWTNFNEHPKAEHPAYRYRDYMEMTKRILDGEMSGYGLSERIKSTESRNLVIYGDNDLAEILIKILKKDISDGKSGSVLKCCIARDTCKDIIEGISIIPLKEYKTDNEDLILISNFMDKSFVKRDLEALGFAGRIISIDELYT